MLLKNSLLIILLISPAGFGEVFAQSHDRNSLLAILEFGNSGIAKRARLALSENLKKDSDLNLLDSDQVSAAAKGSGYLGSLNMSLEEARNLGAAIGGDYYIVGDAQNLRRSPSTGPVYFESYASIFVVSSRTGRLVAWQRPNFRAATADAAGDLLVEDLSSHVTRDRVLIAIRRVREEERIARETALDQSAHIIEGAPDDDKEAESQGLRLPRPYRRLSPPYPETAATAEVEATVDVLAELDANGEVGHVEIARWAGFGLDEATVHTVKQLHFFPAMRHGIPIPLRVLLRYNFRKPAK
jgi:TonB family protein